MKQTIRIYCPCLRDHWEATVEWLHDQSPGDLAMVLHAIMQGEISQAAVILRVVWGLSGFDCMAVCQWLYARVVRPRLLEQIAAGE